MKGLLKANERQNVAFVDHLDCNYYNEEDKVLKTVLSFNNYRYVLYNGTTQSGFHTVYEHSIP